MLSSALPRSTRAKSMATGRLSRTNRTDARLAVGRSAPARFTRSLTRSTFSSTAYVPGSRKAPDTPAKRCGRNPGASRTSTRSSGPITNRLALPPGAKSWRASKVVRVLVVSEYSTPTRRWATCTTSAPSAKPPARSSRARSDSFSRYVSVSDGLFTAPVTATRCAG